MVVHVPKKEIKFDMRHVVPVTLILTIICAIYSSIILIFPQTYIAFTPSAYWTFASLVWTIPTLFLWTIYRLCSASKMEYRSLTPFPTMTSTFICFILTMITMTACFACRLTDKSIGVAAFTHLMAQYLFVYSYCQLYTRFSINEYIFKQSPCLHFCLYTPFLILFYMALISIYCVSSIHSVMSATEAVLYGTPEGSMIRIPGQDFSLHYYCTGHRHEPNDPIIWYVHGDGGQYLDFSRIQTATSEYALSCSFDHGGMGYSHPGFWPRSTSNKAREFLGLLNATGHLGEPIILVGHGTGEWTIRSIARMLEHLVVGTVLIHPVGFPEACDENNIAHRTLEMRRKELFASFGFYRMKTMLPSYREKKAIESHPFKRRYISNHVKNIIPMIAQNEKRHFESSCGWTRRVASNHTLSYAPFGVIFSRSKDEGLVPELWDFSAHVHAWNATAKSHYSLLFQDSFIVSKMVDKIWLDALKRRDTLNKP